MRTSHSLRRTKGGRGLFGVICLRFCSIARHSDPKKEINYRFFVDPPVDFHFVDPAQFSDVAFDRSAFINTFSYFLYA
jgi:hypothetical protein